MTELEQTLREWRPYGCEPVWPLMRQAADAIAARDARIAELTRALSYFLADERFQVAVGGNPIAVERMLAEAREALAKEQSAP